MESIKVMPIEAQVEPERGQAGFPVPVARS